MSFDSYEKFIIFSFLAIGTVVLGQLMNNIARVPPAILEVGDERTERGAWKKSA